MHVVAFVFVAMPQGHFTCLSDNPVHHCCLQDTHKGYCITTTHL